MQIEYILYKSVTYVTDLFFINLCMIYTKEHIAKIIFNYRWWPLNMVFYLYK